MLAGIWDTVRDSSSSNCGAVLTSWILHTRSYQGRQPEQEQERGAWAKAVLRIPRARRQWALHSILQLAFQASA